MKTIHLALHTRGLALPQLSVFSQNIVSALSENKNFPNLYPPLSTLQTAINDLDTAIANARHGDKASTAATHIAEEKVCQILKAMVAHVQYESNNDEMVALSSGFSLKQSPKHVNNTFNAWHGLHKGTVELRSPRHTNSGFIWQYATGISADWIISAITLQASHRVVNLTVGKEYWFRVAMVTKDGQQPFSDPLSLIVI